MFLSVLVSLFCFGCSHWLQQQHHVEKILVHVLQNSHTCNSFIQPKYCQCHNVKFGIAGFSHVKYLVLGGQLQMETHLTDRVKYSSLSINLVFVSPCIQFNKICSLHKAQSGNMCKVDLQALPYVKVSSETYLMYY